MYLVVVDPAHGIVAAPDTARAITEGTEQQLIANGFHWNEQIQAYVLSGTQDPHTAACVAHLLTIFGHDVIWA